VKGHAGQIESLWAVGGVEKGQDALDLVDHIGAHRTPVATLVKAF
jgi:hypothetical protein